MLNKWLSLLITLVILNDYSITMVQGTCMAPKIIRGPCHNGIRTVTTIKFVKAGRMCKPIESKITEECGQRKKRFCKCSALGDPHYQTYDGQVFHFYGSCRYTFSKYKKATDRCSFNIEVQNKYKSDDKTFPYTNTVIIHIFGQVYELGQGKTLKVNKNPTKIPYEKGAEVKIFQSRHNLLFVAPKCSIRVGFDGDSNAFVQVSSRFAGKMSGLCGDCNGKHDDLRTKDGKDVSGKKNKYSLVGNSYNVSRPGKACLPAKEVSYEDLCDKNWLQYFKAKKFCGGLIEEDSPFKKCENKGYIVLKQFYENCLIDLCSKTKKPKRWQKVRCELFSGLANVCSDNGVAVLDWRKSLNCPLKCRKNSHLSVNAKLCPRTCENYFYGSKSPCYDSSSREGCDCDKGYIRDGSLCVLPTHCRCINLCVDRDKAQNCKDWKSKGHCKLFSKAMSIICPKTCGFCKVKEEKCEDYLNIKRCLKFRRQGLCSYDFYKAVCGLTCNSKKCGCGKEKTVVGKCNKHKNRITITHIRYVRDPRGICAKVVAYKYKVCNCKRVAKRVGPCNFCTGKRSIFLNVQMIIDNKCVTQRRIHFEKCKKCEAKLRFTEKCIADRVIKKITVFHKLKGCFHCLKDHKLETREIKCKNSRTEKLDKRTCIKHIKLITRRPVNCKCVKNITNQKIVWCCNKKPKVLKPFCQKGKIVHRTIFYVFRNHGCHPIAKDKTEIPKCKQNKRKIKGKCHRLLKGVHFCKAADETRITKINSACKCVVEKIRHTRTCCCKKPRNYTTCNRKLGILTAVQVEYSLIKKIHKFECLRKVKQSSKAIKQKTEYLEIKGKCHKDCLSKNKIMKKFRDGCTVKVQFVKFQMRLCCCLPKHTKSVECIANGFVTKVFKRELKSYSCHKVLISNNKKGIVCPKPIVKETKCIYPRNKKKVTKIFYLIRKCKCVRKEQVKFEKCKDCLYKETKTKEGPCNKKTCQRVISTHFQNKYCENSVKKTRATCCCRQRPIKSSYCDRFTGYRYNIVKFWQFNPKLRSCISRTTKKAHRSVCKKDKVIKGGCGKIKKYFRKIITIREIVSPITCKCKKTEIVTWNRCSCPAGKTTRRCIGKTLEITKIGFRLTSDETKCVGTKSVKRHSVICPLVVRHRTKILSKCSYKSYSGYMRPKNCKCTLHWDKEILFKCCDRKPIISSKCLKNKTIVTKITTFIVSKDRKKCIPSITRKSVAITCPRYVKVEKTKCKKGIYWMTTTTFEVVKCKCVKAKKTRVKIICKCIPGQTIKRHCTGTGIKTITTKFTLISGKCVPSAKTEFNPTRCGGAIDKPGKCNRITGMITVSRLYYAVMKCKCVQRKSSHSVRCPCFRKDRIVKKQCIKMKRIVELLRHKLHKSKCIWKTIKSYTEDCQCSRNSVVTQCFKNSAFRSNLVNFQLKTVNTYQIPIQQCVISRSVVNKPINCNRGYSEKRCVNHQIIETKCEYVKINCRCVKNCRMIKIGPCQCRRLNKCVQKCIKNRKYSVCNTFKRGRKICEKSQKQIPITEKCLRAKVHCKSCSVKRNNGIYKMCIKTFYEYQNCKCLEKQKPIFKLCKCDRDRNNRPYCLGNRKAIDTISFYPIKNQCVERKKQNFIKIDCPASVIKSDNRKCSTKYTLIYYEIKNCKCLKKLIQKTNSKCCRKSTINKKCAKDHWIYTQTHFQQKSTTLKLFPTIKTSVLQTFCQTMKKDWMKRISCPRSYEVKTCHRKTNKLETKVFFHVVIHCKCILKVTTKFGPCINCPKEKKIRSKCGPVGVMGRRYFDVTIKGWKKLKSNKCSPFVRKLKEVCLCEKTKNFEKCSHGKRIFTTIWYNIKTKPICKPMIEKRSISMPCYNNGRKNKWIVTKVNTCRRPGQFTVKHFERFEFQPKTCICKKVHKVKKTGICCKPCHYKTVCKNNNFEHISICEQSKGLKCVKRVSRKIKSPNCGKPLKEVVGNCDGKVIRYRITTFKKVNCKCIKSVTFRNKVKPADRRICVKNTWKITRIPYKLIHGVCKRGKPQILSDSTVCIMSIRFVDKRINSCTFKRLYIGKIVKNCVCVDKVIRSEILNYKCCKKDIVKLSCLKDRVKFVSTTRYRLVDFKCYPVIKVSKTFIKCHLKTETRKPTGKCTYKIMFYSVFIKNCKCYRKFLKALEKETCCRKPFSKTFCDSLKGFKVTILTSFHHKKDDTCVKLEKRTSIPINCHRLTCSKIESKCVKKTKTIRVFCFKRKGCKCIKVKVKKLQTCCGKRFSWIKSDSCGQNKRDFIRTRYYALKFVPKTKLCQAIIVKETYKRCRCSELASSMRCVKDNSYLITRTSYVLKGNSCNRVTAQNIIPVKNCPKKITIKIKETCNRKTGWKKILYRTTYPKNCKCLQKTFTRKEICICSIAFPNPKERTFCKEDYIVVKEKRIAKCSKKGVKWSTITNRMPILHCKKTKTEIGRCYKSKTGNAIKIRYDVLVQYFMKNCRCQRKEIKRTLKHCVCKRSHSSIKCVGNRKIQITFNYVLIKGVCLKRISKAEVKVPCTLKPIIHKSPCKKNKYTLTKTSFARKNCQCAKSIQRKSCDCKCPKDRKYRKCSGKYFINEITVKYQKQKCICHKKKFTAQIVPVCPRFIAISKGACLAGKHGSYREVIKRHLEQNKRKCHCKVKQVKLKVLCGCPGKLTEKKLCKYNNEIIEVWGWKINRKKNKCEKYLKSSNRKPIVCPPKKVQKFCDKKTGSGKEVTEKYELRNCKCHKSKSVRKYKCKCKETPVLVRKGKCSGRPKCLRTDHYRHESLRGEKCENIKTRKIVTCCCPKNQQYEKCEKNNLFKITIDNKLLFHKCVRKEIKKAIKLTCSDRISKISGKCKKTGYKTVRYFRETLKNCKCIKEKIKSKKCQCQCRKTSNQTICNPRTRSLKTVITKYLLTKCKCQPKKSETLKLILCPRDSSLTSNCLRKRGSNHWIITTRTKKFRVNRKCQCVSKTTAVSKICRCEKNKKVKTHCNSKTHATVTMTTFNVLRNGRCTRIVRTATKPVKCDGKWRIKTDSGCKPHGFYGIKTVVYSKLVHDNCNCKEVTKSVSCHCACSGPGFSKLCINERFHRKVFYYKIIKCKCQQLIRSERISPVKCKKFPPKISKCQIVRNRCVRIVEHKVPYTIKCKCFYKNRIEQQPCQTCSCRTFSNQKCNHRSNNIIITTKECRILSSGWVKKNVKITTKEVPCVLLPKCKQITKCNKKTLTQTFDCLVSYKDNCKCKSKHEKKVYPCVCKPVEIRKGKCNRKKCVRNIIRTKFHLIVSIYNEKKCVKKSRVFHEKCCCPLNPKDVIKCHKNRLIKKIRKYQFDKVKKTCSIIKQNLDVTPICKPAVKFVRGKCNIKTCLVTNKYLHKQIILCRCIKTKKPDIRECCCKRKDYKERKCIGRLSITISHRFVFKNSKCSESLQKNSVVINCKAPRIERLKCNPLTRKRKVKYHSFKNKNCKCIPKLVIKEILCRCQKPFVRRICLAGKGIVRIIYKSYRLNEKLNKCDEIVKNEDQKIKCNKKKRTSCILTTHRHNNGIYKRCTTIWSQRIGCKCVEQLQWIFALSTCKKSKTSAQCLKNLNVKRKIYYVKQRSLHKKYDYSCVRKEQILPAPQILCKKPYIKKSKCVKSFRTYTHHFYIRTSCQCVPQMKVHRVICACGKQKEISRKCVNGRKIRKTFRTYKLNCDNKPIPNCKCMYVDHNVDLPIKCPDDQFKELCIRGKGVKIWTTYDVKNCKCVPDKQKNVRSDCKNTICHDILPGKKCKIIKKFGKCQKLNVYSQFLCPITCGYCEKCQPTTIKKYLSQCACKYVAGKKICSRKALVNHGIPKGRKCPTKSKVVETFCDCTNELSNKFCLKSMQQGHCRQIKIKQKCAYHCSSHCRQCGKNQVYKSCMQDGKNKGKFEVLRIKFFKIKNACFFTRAVSFVGHCKLCDTKPYKTVLSCFNGKRFVVTKFVKKLPDGSCQLQQKKEAHSCRGCCKDILTRISSCSNNSRVITTTFWSNVKGQCKEHKVTNVYNCDKKCSNVKVLKTNCVYNKQLVVKTWYSDSVCVPHVFYEVVRC